MLVAASLHRVGDPKAEAFQLRSIWSLDPTPYETPPKKSITAKSAQWTSSNRRADFVQSRADWYLMQSWWSIVPISRASTFEFSFELRVLLLIIHFYCLILLVRVLSSSNSTGTSWITAKVSMSRMKSMTSSHFSVRSESTDKITETRKNRGWAIRRWGKQVHVHRTLIRCGNRAKENVASVRSSFLDRQASVWSWEAMSTLREFAKIDESSSYHTNMSITEIETRSLSMKSSSRRNLSLLT